MEVALCDSQARRDFLGIDLSRESVPDATTLLKFRRLLLANDLTKVRLVPAVLSTAAAQTSGHLVDHVFLHVAVRQWALSSPIPLRSAVGRTAQSCTGVAAGGAPDDDAPPPQVGWLQAATDASHPSRSSRTATRRLV